MLFYPGEVTFLDAKAGTLTVKTKGKDLNLTVESKGTKSALEKIKVGDTVRVSYNEKDGKMIAISLKAEAKAARSEKAARRGDVLTPLLSAVPNAELMGRRNQFKFNLASLFPICPVCSSPEILPTAPNQPR